MTSACTSHDQLEHVLRVEGFEAECVERDDAAEGRCRRYVHYRWDWDDVPVELSVYEPEDLRIVGYSSIDGKPIGRLTRGRVAGLLGSSS